MKERFINIDNLEEKDNSKMIYRVKLFILNNKNQLILIHNNNTIQLPGGHREENEELNDTLKRELYEELGIIDDNYYEPFLHIKVYYKNYFDLGYNAEANVYYFNINSNIIPNKNNINLDELESKTPFKIFYVNKDNIKNFISDSIDKDIIDRNIGNEMLIAIDSYNEL